MNKSKLIMCLGSVVMAAMGYIFVKEEKRYNAIVKELNDKIEELTAKLEKDNASVEDKPDEANDEKEDSPIIMDGDKLTKDEEEMKRLIMGLIDKSEVEDSEDETLTEKTSTCILSNDEVNFRVQAYSTPILEVTLYNDGYLVDSIDNCLNIEESLGKIGDELVKSITTDDGAVRYIFNADDDIIYKVQLANEPFDQSFPDYPDEVEDDEEDGGWEDDWYEYDEKPKRKKPKVEDIYPDFDEEDDDY